MFSYAKPVLSFCVSGIPSLSMCYDNCTWADEMVVELFPWDAGTDDGIKYIVSQKKQQFFLKMGYTLSKND